MTLKDLLRILILNIVFTNTVNLIAYYAVGHRIQDSWQQVIILGAVIFTIQSILIIRVTRRFHGQLFTGHVFNFLLLIKGLLAAFSIWVLTQLWTWYVTGAEVVFPSDQRVRVYLLIFLANTIPAAFLEEILFRHFPLIYGEKRKLLPQQITILAVGIAFIFSISHVSAYFVRDHIPLNELASPLISAFFYGLAYFLVYAITRNIYLVTFIHAFSNNPLYLIDSPFRDTFFFYTYIFVAIIWLIGKEIQKRISPGSQKPANH